MKKLMTDYEQAVKALIEAKKIVVSTGAGISQESGIPTYRDGLTGLWAGHNPQYLETANAFRENPQLVWGWYLWRRQQVARAKPNAGHIALNQMAALGRKVSIITQNIDDLHEKAGSKEVLHLHGSLATPKCFACHRPAALSFDNVYVTEFGALIEPPRCKKCNGKLRPGVIWYGEDLPKGAWKSAMSLIKDCDVLVSVGTSGIVTPASDLPDIAFGLYKTVIHVNTIDQGVGENEPTEISLVGKATEVLTRLYSMMLKEVQTR